MIKPTRKQIIALIITDVAENGIAGRQSIRLYVENRISRKTFQDAMDKGLRIYENRHKKNPNILGFQIGKPKGLYESFHGNPPKTRKLKIGVPEPGEKIIAIGRLHSLEYKPYGSSQHKKTLFSHKLGDDGNKVLPNKPILAVSEDGKQLFVVNDKSSYNFGERGIVG